MLERSPRVRVAIVAEARGTGPSLASPARRARVFLRGRNQLRLAKALRIREVLAFDGDFSAAGFVELRTESRLSLRRRGRPASAWDAGAEGDGRLDLGRAGREQAEAVALGDHGHHQGLELGEALADAAPRAAREGEEGHAVAPAGRLGANRSGSKPSGLSQNPGWRWVTYGQRAMLAPAGMR